MSKITPACGRDLRFQRLGLCMLLWNDRFPEVFLLSPPLIKACDRLPDLRTPLESFGLNSSRSTCPSQGIPAFIPLEGCADVLFWLSYKSIYVRLRWFDY